MTVSVPQLPTPVPQSSDPVNFDVRADALLTALPGTITAMNAQNAENNAINAALPATAAAAANAAAVAAVAVGMATKLNTENPTYTGKLSSSGRLVYGGMNSVNIAPGEQWVRLLTTNSPAAVTIPYFLGTNSSEQHGKITVRCSYYHVNSQVICEHQTYNHKLTHVALVSSNDGGFLTVFVRVHGDNAGVLSWWLSDAYGVETLHNDITAPVNPIINYVVSASGNVVATNGETNTRTLTVRNSAHLGEGAGGAGIDFKNRLTAIPTIGTLATIAWLETPFAAGSLLVASRPGVGQVIMSASGQQDLTLDTSGNLGLSVTPSAWGALRAIDMTSGGAVAGSSGGAYLAYNSYYNGSYWAYKTTDTACYYGAELGVHKWFTAPAGTAGNPINFTQAMTLDASGSLGVGTTSPAAKLHVFSSSTNTEVVIDAPDNTPILSVLGSSSSIPVVGYRGLGLRFGSVTGPNAVGFTEQMKLDSSGNLLLGGNIEYGSGIKNLVLEGYGGAAFVNSYNGGATRGIFSADAGAVQFGSNTAHPVIFRTNAAEVARFDANGNFAMGGNSTIGNNNLNDPKTLKLFANSTGSIYGTIAWHNVQWDTHPKASITSGPSPSLNSGYIAFNTGVNGVTERARVNGDGEMLIGTSTGLGAKLEVSAPQGNGIRLRATGVNGQQGPQLIFNNSNNNGQGIDVARIHSALIDGSTGNEAANLVFSTSNAGVVSEKMRLDGSGHLLVGVGSSPCHVISKGMGTDGGTAPILSIQNAGVDSVVEVMNGNALGAASSSGCAIRVGLAGTGRAINAAGTINASGADYAEYERNNGLSITKGSIVGFKADGTLTLTFAEAIRFAVKSTDPSYVGGDVWGSESQVGKRPQQPSFTPPAYVGPATPGAEPVAPADDAEQSVIDDYAEAHAAWNEAFAAHEAGMTEHAAVVLAAQSEFDDVTLPAYESELAAFEVRLEAARQLVDRIAYSGKVPCNVQGATPGDYIVATAAADGSITGIPVSDPDFAQYRLAVGRVNRLLPDGRCEVAVIIH